MLQPRTFGFALLVLIFAASSRSAVTAQTPSAANSSVNKILFESASGNGWELFTVNSDGTNLKQLTNLKTLIPKFGWSRDGQYIAFTSFGEGFNLDLILNVINADGSDLHQVSPHMRRVFAWSPDNQEIAFVTKQNGLGEIFLVGRDGSNMRQITHGDPNVWMNDVYDLSWSPDGKQITFIRPYQLYIVNADATGEKALTPSTNSATAVAWSPDGKQIAFVMTEQNQSAIYTLQIGTSNFTKLIDIPSDFTGIGWSPDGQHLSYTQKNDGVISLFIVDADGKNNHQVANRIAGYSWSPDSKHIAYSADDANLKSQMFIADFKGQNQKVLPGNSSFDQSPSWSPAQ